MIKAITFDLWNTIFSDISYKKQRLELITTFFTENIINYNEIDLKKQFYHYFDFSNWEDISDHHIYTSKRLMEMLRKLDIKIEEKLINSLINKLENVMLTKIPPLKQTVRKTIENLSNEYKLGIISDTGITPGRVIRIALDKYGLLEKFDATIFSDEIGFYKPNSEVFRIALNQLKVKPKYALHVGDRLETDIKGARNCKIKCVWINDRNLPPKPKITPDFEIKKLFDLVKILKSKLR